MDEQSSKLLALHRFKDFRSEHLQRLERVIAMSQKLRVNREKYQFSMMAVFFLELRIDAESIHPTEEKVASIKHFQTSRTDLEAFLGTLKFYD
ncbi:hypothetical protein T11_15121 [Trichinella zimbabwensis]|uniref:Uncharacterized protein n=1 Tax=Trichinella zimbabwensis TaxID=268475 RepID=A0A0V1HLU7_9BILA|nr:hypothetical protein T11_15121 [Trichinella zimbabwensis]